MLNRKTLMYVCDQMLDKNLFIYGLLYILRWAEMMTDWSEKWAGCKWTVFFISRYINGLYAIDPYHCPRQHPCGSHIITTIHIIAMSAATAWCDNWIYDVNFRHRNRAWVGLQGARRHSMTVLKRHGSTNLWRKFKKRHEVWSVMLNTWRYLRSS